MIASCSAAWVGMVGTCVGLIVGGILANLAWLVGRKR